LENHHIAASFLVTVSDEKFDVFEKLEKDEYRKIRERMISMVLATDMSFHFSDMAKLKARLASSGTFLSILLKSFENPLKFFENPLKFFENSLKFFKIL